MTTWEEVQQERDEVAEKFTWLFFYDTETIDPNTWMGHRIQKNPLDLFIYSQIAWEVKPELVIETGSFYGGSARWWADILSIVHGDDRGRVISIDVNAMEPDKIRNVEFIQGSSIAHEIIEKVRLEAFYTSGPILVNLDSLHDKQHVRAEMDLYHEFVTLGSYMIVEDGVINGHPTHPEYGPGPFEACQEFLVDHPEFVVDRDRERLLVTANPDGFLRRIRE